MNQFFSPTKILDSLILLHIVTKGPMHGYALTAAIEEKTGWKPSQTAVYNVLKSMEENDLVTAEEKIEKGRVQKIYSITKKGTKFFVETKEHMKQQMRKNFMQFLSLAQTVGEVETSANSEELQAKLHAFFDKLRRIQFTSTILLKDAAEETETILDETLSSLRKIADKHGVNIKDDLVND